MGKVTYGQSGYVGSSMSESACEAYKNDEKPKSKWTKTAMLAAISAWCKDNRRVMLPEIAKMRKFEIFSRFFCWTSWHHTGKYAAETDFYGIDDDECSRSSRAMTGVRELAPRGGSAQGRDGWATPPLYRI